MKYRVKISNFVFGVPATFIGCNYNAEQFKLVCDIQRDSDVLRIKRYTKTDSNKFNDLNRSPVISIGGGLYPLYSRVLIKFR